MIENDNEERKNKFIIEDLDESEEVKEPEESVMRERDPNKPKKFEPGFFNDEVGQKAIGAIGEFFDTSDHGKEFLINKETKTISTICYIPFLFLFILAQKKYSKENYIRFHANNGAIITFILLIVALISTLAIRFIKIDNVFTVKTPQIVYDISFILYCIPLAFMIFGIINTVEGKSKELPFIGKIKLVK